MVTAASLEEKHVREILDGGSGFCSIPNRMYSMERYVAAPRDAAHILEVCADLLRAAVRHGGGNALVFLPGMRISKPPDSVSGRSWAPQTPTSKF